LTHDNDSLSALARLSSEYYCRWVSPFKYALDDESLAFALELMQNKGYDEVVFFDRNDPFTTKEWIEWCRSDKRMFIMLYKTDGTPLACAWFEHPSDTGAQVFSHFSTFDTGTVEDYVTSGRLLLKFLSERTKIKQVIGVTPCVYRHAWAVAVRLGYQKLTILKNAVRMYGKERDAILSINNICELEV